MIQQEGVSCCSAKADKFWVVDADKVPWGMYTLLEDVEAETADDPKLRDFLRRKDPTSFGSTITRVSRCSPT